MADLSGIDANAVSAALPRPSGKTYSYARSHRIAEVFGLVFGSALLLETARRVVSTLPEHRAWLALGCTAVGLCFADLLSGIVHWSADSYGHARMPIFGGFVRTFREHHTDQLDITRHDAIETNGDVFIFSSPVHLVLLCILQSPYALALVLGIFLGSYCNSQIHKWAHQADPPQWVRAMQRSRLFLSPEHHSRHHAGTHESHYCITTGWMNTTLDRIHFFRIAETVLSKLGIQRSN